MSELPSSLEIDFRAMKLSTEDLEPLETFEDRRKLAKVESAYILSKRFLERDQSMKRIKREQEEKLRRANQQREQRIQRWIKKTSRSPFLVDLVAEDERITEERKMRTRQFEEKTKRVKENTHQAKQNIILRALEETSELEALRREKREILEEERRLRALLSLEKSQANPESTISQNQGNAQKMRVLASQRIYKQRKYAQKQKKREEYERELEAFRKEESQSLIRKHHVKPKPDNTFTSIDNYEDLEEELRKLEQEEQEERRYEEEYPYEEEGDDQDDQYDQYEDEEYDEY